MTHSRPSENEVFEFSLETSSLRSFLMYAAKALLFWSRLAPARTSSRLGRVGASRAGAASAATAGGTAARAAT
eukprot:7244469-Pyramimonas_sp.AAC.1